MRYLLFLAFLLPLTLSAQRPAGSSGGGQRGGPPAIKGSIRGQVIDEESGVAVEYATIVLRSPDGEKQITGTVTEGDGSFRLSDIPAGKYQLALSFIGYQERVVDIETTPKRPDLDLEQVRLQTDAVLLEGVEVTARAALIENRIDKLVYNAEKDATNQGGDASDVLRKVPLLSVDLEGNVSLRGSNNLRILVNGRPSTIFASNVADALKSIPGDQIKSVEVITTPGARYDAEGSGGIINIITKKQEAEGFTSSVNTSLGTRQNSGGLNVNALFGRFGLNGGVNGRWSWPRDASLQFLRTDLENGTPIRQLGQSGENNSGYGSVNGSLGAFYDFNAYNSLNLSGRLNTFSRSRDGLIEGFLENFATDNRFEFDRLSDNRNSNTGFDGTLDYRKTFPDRKEQELIVAFQLSGQDSRQESFLDQSGDLPVYQRDLNNVNDGVNLEYTGQIDFIRPLSEKVKLETGIKAVLRRIDSDYRTEVKANDGAEFIADPRLTDLFFYDQDVLAAFLSFNVQLAEKWSLQAGARYEATLIGGEFRSENPGFENTYNNFLPSLILNRKLSQFSNLKGSFTQRIQRPSLSFINPFATLADPNSIEVGNPDLEPELVDQYELAYNTFIKGVVINGAVYYRKTSDLIEPFLRLDEDGVASTTTYFNIGESDTYGFDVFTTFTLFKKLRLRGGLNYGRYNGTGLVGGERLSRSADIVSGNAGGSYEFSDRITADFFLFGRGRRQTLQGSNPSFQIFGVGAKYQLNERTSFGLRIIEPFAENKPFRSDLAGPTFVQSNSFEIPFRSFGVSFSHQFGQIDFRAENRRSRVRNNDQKEGGDGGEF